MDVINKNIAFKLKKIGVKQDSDLYYIKKDKISRLCAKTKRGNYLIIKGPKITKIISKNDKIRITSAFTLSEINNILKYYNNYFKIYYNFEDNTWKINKSIFKIYFLNHNKRKYINLFNDLINKKFNKEIDIKAELLYFLIITEFINIDDIK